MTHLQDLHAKVCLTACGWLLHEGKVLLVHHKKLNFWLAPGGHLDEGEMPHQTAEREFWEETGIKVQAFSAPQKLLHSLPDFELLPHPFYTNLHWVCKENYQVRVKGSDPEIVPAGWQKKGCEQHLGWSYFVKPADPSAVKFTQNIEETLGIGWFSAEEVEKLPTIENIKQEARFVFANYPG